jgi:hypothetical protein
VSGDQRDAADDHRFAAGPDRFEIQARDDRVDHLGLRERGTDAAADAAAGGSQE